MNRWLNTALCPPCALVDCGCAAYCHAPIGVLYAGGIFALVYGLLFGGPLGAQGISWGTVLVGLALWSISATWSALVVLRYAGRCSVQPDVQPSSARADPNPARQSGTIESD